MTAPRTPEEALAFLSALSPSVVRLGLDRIESALSRLGHPERAFRAVQVAGTNGKGSTCAFLASCLATEGYRVGLYTSPHLVRVNERIRINGVDISDALLGQRLLEVFERYPEAARAPHQLSYFELGTLVAFWHFAKEKVDVAVLETGLGGRLDATTACLPIATVITPISFDHLDQLGHSLGAIAGEKAGILKRGVPAYLARQPPEALRALEDAASRLDVPVRLEGRDFFLEEQPGRTLRYQGRSTQLSGLTLGLRGRHQRQNAAVALACLEGLGAHGLPVSGPSLVDGLGATRWPGRLEELELGEGPSVLLDGAHNPAGAEVLVRALTELYPTRRVHLVFSVLADKDFEPILRLLFPRATTVHLAPVKSPRALLPERYLEQARALCPSVTAYPGVEAALTGARAVARPEDLILCAGSLMLVGEVKAACGARTSSIA